MRSPALPAQSVARSRGHCLQQTTVRSVVGDTARGRHGPSAAGKRLDRFNEGWIDFEGEKATMLNGQMNLERLLGALVLEAG